MKRAHGGLVILAMLIVAGLWLLLPDHWETPGLVKARTLVLEQGGAASIVDVAGMGMTYESTAPGIVAVDPNGTVKAVSAGRAAIYIRSGSKLIDTVQVTVKAQDIGSIHLNASELTLGKGDVSALAATDNTTGKVVTVSWSSSDDEKVSVDVNGRIVANNVGTAVITAQTASGATASARVNVTVAAKSFTIAQQDITVGIGATVHMTPVFKPADATDTEMTWESSDAEIAEVSADGVLLAKAVGQVQITGRLNSGLESSTTVTVDGSPAVLKLEPLQLKLERGTQQQLTAVLEPAGHYMQWACSSTDVALVDANGLVSAVASGKADITVLADGQTQTCAVEVVTTVQNVVLNMTESYLLRDQTSEPFQLTATVYPEDADDLTLTYSTDNPLVAYASQTGLVTVTGAYGTATITVTAASGASACFTVHVVTELPTVTPQ